MFSFLKKIFSSSKNDTIVSSKNDAVVIEEDNFETPNTETSELTKPESEEIKPKTQEELEELVIQNWWIKQNKPNIVNHYELIYSGINMDDFSNLEAKVGKFTFKRSYFGDNWTITVDEK